MIENKGNSQDCILIINKGTECINIKSEFERLKNFDHRMQIESLILNYLSHGSK